MSEIDALQIEMLCTTLRTSPTDLAKETGIEYTAIYKVLTGTRRNLPVRQILAKHLGKKVEAMILNYRGANDQTETADGQGSRGDDGARSSNNQSAQGGNAHVEPAKNRARVVVRSSGG